MERLGDAGASSIKRFAGDDRIHRRARNDLLDGAAVSCATIPNFAFDFLLDVTAVDYLGQPDDFETKLTVWDENRAAMRRRPQRRHELVLPPRGPHPRFAVVYHLTSTSHSIGCGSNAA